MKVNSIDARKYDAKQLTVEIQPPATSVNYEWLTGAVLPTEFETDIKMGHLKLQVYFKGKDRNKIIRMMSEFMLNFTKSCDLELDGYKGKFRAFMTSSDYEKTITKRRYILTLEFEGYFYDEELKIKFDGVSTGNLYVEGSRKSPCMVEVYAKRALTNYVISGFGEDDIAIEKLETGKTVVIDGIKGLVTMDGENAFSCVTLWKFPALKPGEMTLSFASSDAVVTVRYMPMWI